MKIFRDAERLRFNILHSLFYAGQGVCADEEPQNKDQFIVVGIGGAIKTT